MKKKLTFPWTRKSKQSIEEIDLDSGEISTEKSNHIEGERSLPSVNKSTSVNTKLTNLITVACIVLLTIFLLYRYYAGLIDRKREEEAAKGVDMTQQSEIRLPPFKQSTDGFLALGEAPPEPTDAPRGASTQDEPQPTIDDSTRSGTPADTAGNGQRVLSKEEQAALRKLNSAVSFNVKSDGGTVQPVRMPESRPASSLDDPREDALADALKPTYTPGVKASILPDRDMFITKGTFIDCVIEQAIDTKLQGMISCLLSRDVYSTSGTVVLMEKGTKLTGEYHGEVKGNDARVFVLWSLAETPQGVTVELASPGTDPLGRSGINGYVDKHFQERFGAAILISVIEDATDAVVQRQANKAGAGATAGALILPSTTKNSTSLAQEALKQEANIAATLTKNQGAQISVFVARHLDFRGVYKLERTRK